MLISVIIPAYNSEKFLRRSIQSVLNQTHKEIELIIVDDGSTDGTQSLVESFQDPRIKYIYQNNAGPSAARNNGIKNANGEYIAFLDADDEWLPDKLQAQLSAVKANKDVCLVYCSFAYKDEKTGNLSVKHYKNYPSREKLLNKLLTEYTHHEIPFPSTVFIDKSFLDSAGLFNTQINCAEDWDLWLRLACLGNFYSVDTVLVYKYSPDTSLTNNFNIQTVEKSQGLVLKEFFANNSKNKKISKLKPKAFADFYYRLAVIHYRWGNRSLALEYLKNSFKSDPVYFVESSFKVFMLYIFNYGKKRLINRCV